MSTLVSLLHQYPNLTKTSLICPSILSITHWVPARNSNLQDINLQTGRVIHLSMAISNMTEGGLEVRKQTEECCQHQVLDVLYFQQSIWCLTYLSSLKSQVSHPGALQHWWGEPAAWGVQAMEGKDRHFHSWVVWTVRNGRWTGRFCTFWMDSVTEHSQWVAHGPVCAGVFCVYSTA